MYPMFDLVLTIHRLLGLWEAPNEGHPRKELGLPAETAVLELELA
jgi:hypothetical protein